MPDLAMRCNVTDLRTLARAPLAGAVQAGAGTLPPCSFLAVARTSLASALGGTFDPAAFEIRHGWPGLREGDP